MPLVGEVKFTARLHKLGRLQVPRRIKTHYGLETNQLLIVTIRPQSLLMNTQMFHAKISQDNRIYVPNLIFEQINQSLRDETAIVDVTLRPA